MFYHPMGICEILTPDKSYKWRLHAPAAYAQAEANVTVYPFLTGLTVTIERERISTMQLMFEAPYDVGIKMLHEDANTGASPFNTNNLVRMCIGYPAQNLWTPWYQGMLRTGGEGISINNEGVSGTITVQNATWQEDHVSKGVKSWYFSAEQLALDIVTSMGADMVMSTGARGLLEEATSNKNDVWCVLARTNTEVLQMLKNEGIAMIVHNSTKSHGKAVYEFLLPHEESQVGDKMGMNTFVMRGAFDPLNNQYPLLSFGPDAKLASWAGSKPKNSNEGVTVGGLNKLTGTISQEFVPPGSASEAPFGTYATKGPAQDISTADGKIMDKAVDDKTAVASYVATTGKLDAPDSGDKKAKQTKGKGFMSDGAEAENAVMTTIGIPTQGIGKIINILGCSRRFDGPYMVYNITHRWAAGLYETDLTIKRQGSVATNEIKGAPIVVPQMKKN